MNTLYLLNDDDLIKEFFLLLKEFKFLIQLKMMWVWPFIRKISPLIHFRSKSMIIIFPLGYFWNGWYRWTFLCIVQRLIFMNIIPCQPPRRIRKNLVFWDFWKMKNRQNTISQDTEVNLMPYLNNFSHFKKNPFYSGKWGWKPNYASQIFLSENDKVVCNYVHDVHVFTSTMQRFYSRREPGLNILK